jgi:hypothetical protein
MIEEFTYEEDIRNLNGSYKVFGQILNEYNTEIDEQKKIFHLTCLKSVLEGIAEINERIQRRFIKNG